MMQCNLCGAEIDLTADAEALTDPDDFICMDCWFAEDEKEFVIQMKRRPRNELHNMSS